MGTSRSDEPLRCAWRDLKQASLQSEPPANKSAVQADASPKRAIIQTSLNSQDQAEQGQPHEQAEHGKNAEIEPGMSQAKDQCLGHNRGTRPGVLREFSPEPSPEQQLFGEPDAKAQCQSIESIRSVEFAKPASPGSEQKRQADQGEQCGRLQ